MKTVKTVLVGIVALALAWVLATQDRTAIFQIDPTVDLPALCTHSTSCTIESVPLLQSKEIVMVRADGGSIAEDAAQVSPLLCPCATKTFVRLAVLAYRAPLHWRLNSPSTAPPV
jgi:hypothetical protein